ncbi:uncharacterized protein BDW47DRAFT_105411 [Aspergillus candidus]|uniref:Uncharacterized protein n=1 Tax=Aspergillus candidus TaxID=41067 RepID=A0A2I2FC11_ASPCN|nr:hypothetical protein BDW47DRAFT_105411 [Aspergillus candidus]PLB38158.1 hypothetical protein BDW47DRAFT_105411 [Aspergillus candidus]
MPSVRRGAVDIVVVWYVATGRMPPVSPAPGVGAVLTVALGGDAPLVVFLGLTLFVGLLMAAAVVVVFLLLSRVGGLGADGFVGGVSHV